MATKSKGGGGTQSGSAKHGTVIMSCTCSHAYQDKTYGNGRRLHNLCKKGAGARCTICLTVRDHRG